MWTTHEYILRGKRGGLSAALFLAVFLAGCAKPEPAQWFRDDKFGLFIHWGPVSLKGTEIGWSRAGERRGRKDKSTGTIPVEVYDNLYKEFNPTGFNADEWAKIAKAAGMRYLVFTTKHHDGFCMFDSALTDYKITHSPFRRDVVAELAKACRANRIRLGFYYSPPDWHHPDYRTAGHPRYIEYMHGQIRELLSNYGKVDVLWFDGLGGTAQDWDSERLFATIHELQPDVIVNNRGGLPGDYDTPEQKIGAYRTDRAWETCMTLGKQWAWKPNDEIKSLKECIHILARTVGSDGNLLLNVGPMPDGRIEPRQAERLKEIGDWLRKYGESIYRTRGGPFPPGPWGASTHRGNTIYLHVLAWEGHTVRLPAIAKTIVKSWILTGGIGTIEQDDEGIEVTLSPMFQDSIDTIIRLELDGPAAEANPAPQCAAAVSAARTCVTAVSLHSPPSIRVSNRSGAAGRGASRVSAVLSAGKPCPPPTVPALRRVPLPRTPRRPVRPVTAVSRIPPALDAANGVQGLGTLRESRPPSTPRSGTQGLSTTPRAIRPERGAGALPRVKRSATRGPRLPESAPAPEGAEGPSPRVNPLVRESRPPRPSASPHSPTPIPQSARPHGEAVMDCGGNRRRFPCTRSVFPSSLRRFPPSLTPRHAVRAVETVLEDAEIDQVHVAVVVQIGGVRGTP